MTAQTNRITERMKAPEKVLSIYFTAGYPALDDTRTILKNLQDSGVDLVEIGLPFSDPLADGPTIQYSSTQALHNGMSTAKLFEQLEGVREEIDIPLVLMGYFNPMLQYGVEAFCKKCQEVGIDGIIMPDLPVDVYQREYQEIYEKYNLLPIFLITPQTPEARIQELDAASKGFLYMVSTASTTGAKSGFGEEQFDYFNRIGQMGLQNEQVVGFGIHDSTTFEQATSTAKGAIIGSAFIKHLGAHGPEGTADFVHAIRPITTSF